MAERSDNSCARETSEAMRRSFNRGGGVGNRDIGGTSPGESKPYPMPKYGGGPSTHDWSPGGSILGGDRDDDWG